MARGGRRSGQPGQSYGNRTDLNAAPRLAPTAQQSQPYGVAGDQLKSQQSLPMAPPPAIPISAPTNRPNEPVQSGLPIGPGPGPSAAALPSIDPVETTLRGLYAAYPNQDLADLLEELDTGRTF